MLAILSKDMKDLTVKETLGVAAATATITVLVPVAINGAAVGVKSLATKVKNRKSDTEEK